MPSGVPVIQSLILPRSETGLLEHMAKSEHLSLVGNGSFSLCPQILSHLAFAYNIGQFAIA